MYVYLVDSMESLLHAPTARARSAGRPARLERRDERHGRNHRRSAGAAHPDRLDPLAPAVALAAAAAVARIERQRFDYGELEAAIAHADQVTRETRRALDRLLRGRTQEGASLMSSDKCGSRADRRRGRQL